MHFGAGWCGAVFSYNLPTVCYMKFFELSLLVGGVVDTHRQMGTIEYYAGYLSVVAVDHCHSESSLV